MLVVIFVISKAVPPKQHDITNTFDLIKKAVQHHLNFLIIIIHILKTVIKKKKNTQPRSGDPTAGAEQRKSSS
jgi:hypothetical protein